MAVEPDRRRRAAAERAARAARVPMLVVDAVAERLPLADGGVDAAVASLALCSVPDVTDALVELRCVLRPGGELRFLEHVLADRGPLRFLQRLVAPVYSRMPDGCHIDRDTVASIAGAGFAIESCDRFMHADVRARARHPARDRHGAKERLNHGHHRALRLQPSRAAPRTWKTIPPCTSSTGHTWTSSPTA